MDVGVQQRDRFVLFLQFDAQNISQRQDTGEPPTVEHDEVTHVRVLHAVQAIVATVTDVRYDEVGRHRIAYQRRERISPFGYDAAEDVPLGEDPRQSIALQDRKRADLV